jgi:hypothetical protein
MTVPLSEEAYAQIITTSGEETCESIQKQTGIQYGIIYIWEPSEKGLPLLCI